MILPRTVRWCDGRMFAAAAAAAALGRGGFDFCRYPAGPRYEAGKIGMGRGWKVVMDVCMW